MKHTLYIIKEASLEQVRTLTSLRLIIKEAKENQANKKIIKGLEKDYERLREAALSEILSMHSQDPVS